MSTNLYTSTIRRHWAKGVAEANVIPTANGDLTISNFRSNQIFDFEYGTNRDFDPNTNFLIHSAGLFCNYSDGLMPTSELERIMYSFRAAAWTGAALTGNVTVVAGNKTVTGSGTLFTSELVDGSIFTDGRRMYLVDGNPPSDTSLTLANVPIQNGLTSSMNVLTLAAQGVSRIYESVNLNEVIEINRFFAPITLSLSSIEYLTFQVAIVPTVNPVFKTISISSDYASEEVIFDMAMDIEYTS